LVPEGFLSLVLGSQLLKFADWLLLIQCAQALREVLASEMSLLEVLLYITVELPYVNTVTLTDTDDLRIVPWVKHDVVDRICVADEALEVVRDSLLSLIVPDLYHAVLATGQKVAGIVGDVNAVDASSVNVCYFS
jgi:hypothetical protein